MSEGSRLARWRGLVGIAVRRTLVRTIRTERTRTGLSAAGVAVAVALLLLVTTVAVGVSGGTSVSASSADFAIVPTGETSAVTNVDNARLGRSHEVAARLGEQSTIRYATPVRTELLSVHGPDGQSARLLLVGVVPPSGDATIAGLSIGGLTPGDPHYANGTYDGPWTREAVISEAAAETIGATAGSPVIVTGGGGNQTMEITNVSAPQTAGLGQFPVVVVHLAELQAIADPSPTDVADQLFVEATTPAVRSRLATVYPETTVVERDALFGAGSQSRLSEAIAVAAFAVSLVIGTLFMMTTLGFELAADRPRRAVMRAIGLSARSRTVLLVAQTLAVAILGGVLGIVLWLAGVVGANAIAEAMSATPVATVRPILGLYGLGAAALMGLSTVPYLLVVTARQRLDPPTQ